MSEKTNLKITEITLPRWVDFPTLELYMDQVTGLLDNYLSFMRHDSDEKEKIVTPSIINNYVKQGMIPPPTKKKYSKEHLAKLVILCTLKQVMPLSSLSIILDTMLKNEKLETVYNNFCDDFEKAVKENVLYASDKSPKYDENIETALKLSIKSSSAKLVADSIIL